MQRCPLTLALIVAALATAAGCGGQGAQGVSNAQRSCKAHWREGNHTLNRTMMIRAAGRPDEIRGTTLSQVSGTAAYVAWNYWSDGRGTAILFSVDHPQEALIAVCDVQAFRAEWRASSAKHPNGTQWPKYDRYWWATLLR